MNLIDISFYKNRLFQMKRAFDMKESALIVAFFDISNFLNKMMKKTLHFIMNEL